MAKPAPRPEPSCLYPDEAELARVLLGERAAQWGAIARVEEKAGLPRVSLQYGGRYWPAVKAFYDRRHQLLEQQSAAEPEQDGDNFDAWKPRRARPEKA